MQTFLCILSYILTWTIKENGWLYLKSDFIEFESRRDFSNFLIRLYQLLEKKFYTIDTNVLKTHFYFIIFFNVQNSFLR